MIDQIEEVVTKHAGDGWGDNSAPNLDPDDKERRRPITVGGKEFILQARDPFGFWYIVLPHGGSTPQKLSGAYTGLDEAEKGIRAYMAQHPISQAKKDAVENKTIPPKFEYKKPKGKSDAKTLAQA